MICVIPEPKVIAETEKSFKNIGLAPKFKNSDIRIEKALNKLNISPDGTDFELFFGSGESEKYILDIDEKKIVLKADGIRGAFYGIQTLRQIYKKEYIPCCHIEDEPDFKHRGFYHDITRGKVPKLETLKELVDTVALYKMNSLQLYVEHAFEFEEYADSIERTGYITEEEIKELDIYCKENFIEFIPSLSTFGHLYELLIKDRYKHLAVYENYKCERAYWIDRMAHHTIDPLNPESFELIKSLLDRYVPLFSSDVFNICCDETFDLLDGKYKDKNPNKLYIDFVCKIIDYLKSKGKRCMMWGDILLSCPEYADRIPEDTILLNWSYMPDIDENKIKCFKDMNRTQIVCPGTNTWDAFSERLDISVPNIINSAECAYKNDALGLLNTNWGDYGNPCSLELSMAGLCLGAEKAWNVYSDNEKFITKADDIVYGKEGAFKSLMELSEIQGLKKMDWANFVWTYSNVAYPDSERIGEGIPSEETLYEAQERCIKLSEKLKSEVWGRDDIRLELINAVEAVQLTAELSAKTGDINIERKIDTNEWLKKYREAWLKRNKESELKVLENVFITLENNK